MRTFRQSDYLQAIAQLSLRKLFSEFLPESEVNENTPLFDSKSN